MRLAFVVLLIGACGGGPSVPGGGDDDSPPPVGDGGAGGNGRFQYSWELQLGGSTVGCDVVGAMLVRFRSINFDTGDEFRNTVPCVPVGMSTSVPLQVGTYDNQVSLLDGDGFEIQTQFPGISTVGDGDIITLSGVVFRF